MSQSMQGVPLGPLGTEAPFIFNIKLQKSAEGEMWDCGITEGVSGGVYPILPKIH